MEGIHAVMRRAGAMVIALAAGCTTPAGSGPAPQATMPASRVTPDSTSSTLVPPGLGTLKQDELAIILQPNGVRITAIPLDESVIRVLAPDSYRNLRATLESKRQQIARRASQHGLRDPRVWYVSFAGLEPDARFVPTDITVTSGGRDYRPFDVIPLTSGFGEQRLQPRDIQRGLLLFDEALDVSQPITVSSANERNTDWEARLQKIDAERASIRARAGGRP